MERRRIEILLTEVERERLEAQARLANRDLPDHLRFIADEDDPIPAELELAPVSASDAVVAVVRQLGRAVMRWVYTDEDMVDAGLRHGLVFPGLVEVAEERAEVQPGLARARALMVVEFDIPDRSPKTLIDESERVAAHVRVAGIDVVRVSFATVEDGQWHERERQH